MHIKSNNIQYVQLSVDWQEIHYCFDAEEKGE
jgi:hypothetical protein